MRKLEENFKQSGGKWAEFRIGDLFDVDNLWIYGKNKQYETKFKDNTIDSIPVISGITANNGVNYWTKDVLKDSEIFKDSLTISTRGEYSGTVTYHTGIFALANNILVMQMPNWSFESKLYIGTLIQKLGYGGFNNYPRKETLKDDIISLPVLPSCNENKFEIAFEYMESYIKELEAERLEELEAERLEELEAYLLTTGLKDYKLTEQEKVILQDFAKLQNEDSKRGGAFSSLEDYLLYGGSLLDSKKQNFITHALSCLTQRALKSLDTSKWAEFPFYEIFIYERGKRYKKADHTSGKIPYISSSAFNNGIDNYVSPPSYMKIYTNKLTLANSGSVGTCFYHPYSFVASDHCMVIWLKDKEMNTHIALFLLPIFEKLKHKHDFGREINHDRLMQEKFLLPIDSKGNPDFAFMESFIKEIEKEHFLSLIEYYHKEMSAYNKVLETNGGGALSFKLEEYLSFYESYKTTQAHSTQLQWQEVRIGDLFKKVSAKFVGKGDKFKAVSKTKDNIYKIPVVYAKFGDNGIMYWAREGDFETHDNIISIVYNGAIAAGKVYAQKEKTGILAESYFIRLKEYKVSFEVNLFLKCALEKSLYERFSRENLATWDNKVENEFISLPVLPNGEIAFEYIESFIKALQKELIKELVLWNEKELKVAKSLYKNYN